MKIVENRTSRCIIYSSSPESIDEINNWYNRIYPATITNYNNYIIKHLKDSFEKSYIVVYKLLSHIPNRIERKKGLSMYIDQNIDYYKYFENYVLYDNNKWAFLSIIRLDMNSINLLYSKNISSVILSIPNLSVEQIISIINADLSTITNKTELLECTSIRFNDIGCDGNNITIDL